MIDNSDLIKMMRGGDKKAEAELIEHNMGLVYSAAKRFVRRGYEFDDLVQIGSIGLIKAAKKFDISFGTQFSTYAVPMIIGEIKRFLRDDGALKISRSLKETAIKGRRCEEILRKRLNRDPTIREISAECNVDTETLIEAFEAVTPPESIYEQVYDNKNTVLADTIAGTEMEENVINRVLVKEMMNTLTEREKKVLILRYFRGKTQTETAREIGVSQVHISRIEKKAMGKLRSMI